MQTVSARIEPHLGGNNSCLEGSVSQQGQSLGRRSRLADKMQRICQHTYTMAWMDGTEAAQVPILDRRKAMMAQKKRKSQLSRPFLHVSVTPEARAVASNPAANCCS